MDIVSRLSTPASAPAASPNGCPEKAPSGCLEREPSVLSRRDELGAHLGELRHYILQWSEAHEQMFSREQTEGSIGYAFPGSPNGCPDSATKHPSTATLRSNGTEPLASVSSKRKLDTAVFMNEDDLKEATEMLGFSKQKPGRMSRNFSELQRGLDNLMPSQGKMAQGKLAKLEKSTFFELVCFLVITTNTVGLTMTTQLNADGEDEGQFLEDLELACCLFYSCELLLRLSVHQCYFFYRGPVGWNIFDCLLVFLAIQEQASKNDSNNMSYLRTTRILKVLKVLRIIRLLRFFKELRLIIGGIMASFKTLLWTVLLIAVVTFMFSICFVQGMTGLAHRSADVDWSNIPNGMVVLFMSSTGGIDWREASDPLWDSSEVYYCAFILYVFVFTFVIQNTITSLFVECLFEKQNSDEAFLISDRLERRAEYSSKIQTLYAYMDTDGDGQVTFEQLCENLHDPRMTAFAGSLEMELTDLRLFFNVLTCGGRNTIDIETFVVGCIKLRGNAKAIDLVDISRQLHRQLTMLEPLTAELHEMRCVLENRTWAALSQRSMVSAASMNAAVTLHLAAAGPAAAEIQRELSTEMRVEGTQSAASLAERFSAASAASPPISCQLEGNDATLTADMVALETSRVPASDGPARVLRRGVAPPIPTAEGANSHGPAIIDVARYPATMTMFAGKNGSRDRAQPACAGKGHPLGSAMRGVSERSPVAGAGAPAFGGVAPWSRAPRDVPGTTVLGPGAGRHHVMV